MLLNLSDLIDFLSDSSDDRVHVRFSVTAGKGQEETGSPFSCHPGSGVSG